MDSLVEIPRQKWIEFRDLFRDSWPRGVVSSCILDTQLNCPGISKALGFRLYCPEGELTNGIVAVINKVNYQVMLHPVTDTEAIERALLTTSVIDWNNDILVPSANTEVIASLERIKNRIGVNVYNDESESKAYKHVLRRDSKLFDNIICPTNTYIGPLKSEHIDIVNTTWSYQSDSSPDFFKILMKNDLTYVLYSLDHKPMAWVTVNESGALTHLYCLEDHRGKGYAEFITKFVANDLLTKGKDVLAYTVEGNVKAQKLFTKLGFENIGHDYFVRVNRDQNVNNVI